MASKKIILIFTHPVKPFVIFFSYARAEWLMFWSTAARERGVRGADVGLIIVWGWGQGDYDRGGEEGGGVRR